MEFLHEKHEKGPHLQNSEHVKHFELELISHPNCKKLQIQSKIKGLAACTLQTASPFGYLNKYTFQKRPHFWEITSKPTPSSLQSHAPDLNLRPPGYENSALHRYILCFVPFGRQSSHNARSILCKSYYIVPLCVTRYFPFWGQFWGQFYGIGRQFCLQQHLRYFKVYFWSRDISLGCVRP